MSERTPKKRRLRNGAAAANLSTPTAQIFPNDSLAAATEDDRKNWKGFCEIESEPAFFNVMLREFGVKGVKVREVVSLDNDQLDFLPQPVYGLVFLFKWREDDPVKQEPICPPGIWFANQTIDNACASVALLNIINNIPDIDLGENLEQFKEFTATFTPALRGDAIGNFDFIKHIHNSFARKIDMLNADLYLKNQAASNNKNKKMAQQDDDDDDASFHFIAFVPIQGKVWKLDGLERQPQCVGHMKVNDWLRQVKPDIEAWMAEYEEGQIEFAILSLVKDPLLELLPSLASNVKAIQLASTQLDRMKADWREFAQSDNPLTGPDGEFELTQGSIDSGVLPEKLEQKLLGGTVQSLISTYQELTTAQASVRAAIKGELESDRNDEAKAASRRFDYGPLLRTWIRYHARRSIVESLGDSVDLS